MKELTRSELAVCKRTAQNTKSLCSKRDKLIAKIKQSEIELESVNQIIESFEAPIKIMTGGFTSEEVLRGEMELSETMSDVNSEDISGEEVPEVEVPAVESLGQLDEYQAAYLEGTNPFGTSDNNNIL